jgi:hypothetical protein
MAKQKIAIDQAAPEPIPRTESRVTFLGMRHFSIAGKKYSVNRGDVVALDPAQIKHLVEGKSPDDKNADYIIGAVDLNAHDAKKKK